MLEPSKDVLSTTAKIDDIIAAIIPGTRKLFTILKVKVTPQLFNILSNLWFTKEARIPVKYPIAIGAAGLKLRSADELKAIPP